MKKINFLILVYIILFSNLFAEENLEFLKWKKDFKSLALSKNISEKTINKVMFNVKFLPKVIEYDRYQPEFYEDTKTYISKRTSKKKVESGIDFYKKNKNLINEIEKSIILKKNYFCR